MKKFNNMFNNDTINIFTDASVKTINKTMYSAPGCLVVQTKYFETIHKTEIIDSDAVIIKNSTNNNGEIFAILLGIRKALHYKDKKINIISDSMISIEGLKNWYINWFKNKKGDVLYNSEGKIVKNQNLFKQIINVISYENLNIKFIHCRGHINCNSEEQMKIAMDNFRKSNGILDTVDIDLLIEIQKYNSIIDNETRKCFKALEIGQFPLNKVIDNTYAHLFDYMCNDSILYKYTKILKEGVN